MTITAQLIFYSSIFLMLGHLLTFKLSSGRLIIDHITCLYFGMFYYIFMPIWIMSSSKVYLIQNLRPLREFQNLTDYQIESFLIMTFITLVIIIIAEISSKKEIRSFPRMGNINVATMKLFFVFITIAVFPALIDMVPLFFSGYDTSLWVRGSRGPFLSYIVILIALSSMYLSLHKKINLINIFTIFAFTFSLFNLFTGNRGFFITFLISLVVVFSESNKGVKIRTLLILLFIGVISAAVIATIRSSGLSIVRYENIIGIIISQFLAEGSNVATTLFIFLGQHKANLIEAPLSLLSQFINLIPSFIFPQKFNYLILDPRITYYLSSSHMYVMLLVNFGIIGSFLFIYLLIRFLNFAKYRLNNFGIYPALCALIPFMLFRDFELTLVKFMLGFTIIVPLAILLLGNTFKKIEKISSQ